MNARIKFAALAATLLLIGAGCAKTQEKTEVKSDEKMTIETPAKTEDTAAVTAPEGLDDSWKRYENKSLKFSFRWPSKGAHVPVWVVKFSPEKDAVDGCIGEGDRRQIKIGDVAFCQTTTVTGDTRTDRYATKQGFQYIVLVFTKTKPAEGYAAEIDKAVATFSYQK